MQTKDIIFLIGAIVGAILLLGVLRSFQKNNSLVPGGYWIILAGIILFGLSVWQKFTFTPEGGISFETYDELKKNYDSTVTKVNEIKKEKDNITKRLDYFETELKSTNQIGSKDNLLKSLDSIKVFTGKIDANIVKINDAKEIMNKKFKSIDSIENIDKKIKK